MHAYRTLRTGIEAFLALPLNDLRQNASALTAALHNIESLCFKQTHAK
jgi:arsenate reductase (thioredoxin)